MGKQPELEAEVRALGTEMAQPEKMRYEDARRALLEASNEHAVLDVAGIIAWHALISKVVDVSGFFAPKIPNIFSKLAVIAIFARRVRTFFLTPFHMILSWGTTKEKHA